jgi:hypothetical protein
MILLDSDILLIDLRYPNDPRFAINRQALQQLRSDNIPLGLTSQVLLETVGILSFNVSPARVAQLPLYICFQYQLVVLPDVNQHPDYAGCTVQQLMTQMALQMALGDAVQAVQVAQFASFADGLLTWNAKHFQGKLAIPVLTPQDWLHQRSTSTP